MNESTNLLWQRVRDDIDSNRLESAQSLLKAIIAIDPGDTQAYLHLCGLCSAADQQRSAVTWALAAAGTSPDDAETLGDIVAALLWVGEIIRARELLDSPVLATSRSISTLVRTAGQRQAIGEHPAALALMERARSAGADGRDFLFHHAVQLAFNGHLEDARAQLERCIALDPPDGRAFVQLARMDKQAERSNHLDRIDVALKLVAPGTQSHAALEFARHEELSSVLRHEEAWQSLLRGNALMHAHFRHDSFREATLFAKLMDACTADFLRAEEKSAQEGPNPIFVIGMPRSGTTLLERMLGNHSCVASAGELGDFPRSLALATDHLAPIMFDEITLSRLPEIDWCEVGHTYLAQTHWRAHGKPYFVDKLPRNWMVAGLLHLALPRARILHVVRDPMDVCYSNWRAFFGSGHEHAYSYDLDSLASHHQQYCKLMNHWHRVMPGRILDIEYSHLVHDSAMSMRKIFAFCGLAYEPDCEELDRNRLPCATLSMSQVRQRIRTDTFDEWQPYAGQLAGLRKALARPAASA